MIENLLGNIEKEVEGMELPKEAELFELIDDLVEVIIGLKEEDALEELDKIEHILKSEKFHTLAPAVKNDIRAEHKELKEIKSAIEERHAQKELSKAMDDIIKTMTSKKEVSDSFKRMMKFKRITEFKKASELVEMEKERQANQNRNIEILDL